MNKLFVGLGKAEIMSVAWKDLTLDFHELMLWKIN